MVASLFDLFKIGIGPSSSHTMGPMVAAGTFLVQMKTAGLLPSVAKVEVDLYGSLALTGKGHATDTAIMLGLAGLMPANVDPDKADEIIRQIRETKTLILAQSHNIPFDENQHLHFRQREKLDFHSNGMRFTAYDKDETILSRRQFFSIGGGAIVEEGAAPSNDNQGGLWDPPYPFSSARELLSLCEEYGLTIAEIVRHNELSIHNEKELSCKIMETHEAMQNCIDRGIQREGILPGTLKVRRRAPLLHKRLCEQQERGLADPLTILDWVNLWALAVNEENASGGKVVTAPTNGAAGIIPAVLRFYTRFCPTANEKGIEDFLLTATAIGSLFKENASISGAEVGCQGEIGVACSMAAAGLVAGWGGNMAQIENAAEIGMEHNLGLTCDPVAGLVQVPCIERNAVGTVKAIEAARLAITGDGQHRVTLDQVIETMRRTGQDMSYRYKETALGGLAVNVVEC